MVIPRAAGGSHAKQSRETGSLLSETVAFLRLTLAGGRSRRLFGTGRIGRRVVTRTSSDDRLSGSVNYHPDLAVAAIQSLNGGRIGDRVLVADVVRNLNSERLNLGDFLWVKSKSTGGRGQFIQRTSRLRRFTLLFFGKQ